MNRDDVRAICLWVLSGWLVLVLTRPLSFEPNEVEPAKALAWAIAGGLFVLLTSTGEGGRER